MKEILDKISFNVAKLQEILKDESHPLLKNVRINNEKYKESIRDLIAQTLFKNL